jgi:hypothetical protein
MTVEEVKSTVPNEDLDSKATGKVSSTESSSSSIDGPVAYSKQIDSTFDTTEDPRFYKPIPEYEGIHRWDPDFEWTEAEEKAVVRKV